MKSKKWDKNEISFLKKYYPDNGKKWCALKLNRSLSSIRAKTSRLKLFLDHNGKFSRDFHKRAGEKRRGENNSFFGRKHTKETIEKIIKKNKEKYDDINERIKVGKNVKKWIKENGHPRGMLGKHHTKETKKTMSTIRTGKKLKLSKEQRQTRSENGSKNMAKRLKNGGSIYSRANAGWHKIKSKKYYFRSGWEVVYARYLEWLKDNKKIEKWEYEPETFWFKNIKRGVRSYLPDFKITNNNKTIEFHEVKGWMDDKYKTKIKRMKKYYPKIILKIIDKSVYKSIKELERLFPEAKTIQK